MFIFLIKMVGEFYEHNAYIVKKIIHVSRVPVLMYIDIIDTFYR